MYSSDQPSDHFGDDPVSDPQFDRLHRGPLVAQIRRVLDGLRDHTPSGVAALIGPWGSGKSSMLNLLKGQLSNTANWNVVSFNPWLVGDTQALVHQFFIAVSSALPPDRRTKKTRKKLAHYANSVAPFAGAIKVPLIDPGKAVSAISGALHNSDLDSRRDELREELSRLDVPVLVILDDLDRLDPTELVLVFKLVRLVARFPNVYYLLSFDEKTVTDLLSADASQSRGVARSANFLEKIYQIRFDIPPLHASSRSEMFDDGLRRFLDRHAITLTTEQSHRYVDSYHRFIGARIATPRQLKRYVAQADAYYPLVDGEVDPIDFLQLTFLRVFYPQVYALIRESKDDLTATLVNALSGRSQSPADTRTDWASRLGSVGTAQEDVDDLIQYLGLLFLPLRSANENMQYGNEWYQSYTVRKGVGSAEYFDRYFQFGVPPDDIADSLVAAAIAELESCPGEAVEALRQAAGMNGPLVLNKLVGSHDQMSPAAATEMIYLLASIFPRLPDELFISSRRRSVLFASEVLPQTDGTISADRFTSSEDLEFATGLLSNALVGEAASFSQPPPEWVTEFTASIVARCYGALVAATALGLEEVEEWAIPMLYRLREIDRPENVTAFLKDHLDATAWTTSSFIGAMVPVGRAYGGGPPVPTLGHGSVIDQIEYFVDIEWVLERIGDPASRANFIDRFATDEEDYSLERRTGHAMAAIVEHMGQAIEENDIEV